MCSDESGNPKEDKYIRSPSTDGVLAVQDIRLSKVPYPITLIPTSGKKVHRCLRVLFERIETDVTAPWNPTSTDRAEDEVESSWDGEGRWVWAW